MRRFSTILVLIFLLLICSLSAQQTATTSIPNLIRFSGILTGAQGAASANPTPVGVTFAIYKQHEGGAPIWQETQNVSLDANGQYSVLLGSATGTGLPDDLFSQQEQRWLGVQVQGQEEQTRVMLVSVPYAFKAHEADTLGGLPASAFVQATPSGSTASGYTDAVASVNGTAVNALASPANSTTGKRTTRHSPTISSVMNGPCGHVLDPSQGYIPLFLGPSPSSIICDSVIFQHVGNIGIATVNPSAQLDVTGAINTSPTLTVNSSTGNYQILENPVLSIGFPAQYVNPASQNTYVGLLAGAQGFVQDPGTGDTGTSDTFVGYNAAFHNQTGSQNTALGALAGYRNTNGSNNTFLGVDADFGVFDVAVNNDTITGNQAGFQNTGNNVSIYGYQAGYSNTADGNSFFGYMAGYGNTSGANNTFIGTNAGVNNSTGSSNVAMGYSAGAGNGSANVSIGWVAGVGGLGGNNVVMGDHAAFGGAGNNNVIIGSESVSIDAVGDNNTFIGTNVDFNGRFNSNDIFIGFNSGTQGSQMNDIYLGARCSGCDLDHPENNTIRVGTEGSQTDAYMAGVWNSPADSPNQPVCVDSNGKLFSVASGCDTSSSRRLKDQIADMGDSSSKLFQLRPVTFLYKSGYDDGTHRLQYGLIAEEVAQIYPEMVAFDSNGQPSGLKYQMLAPMLLNELQKQHSVVMAQRQEIETLKLQLQQQNASLQLKNASLEQRLQKLESYVETQMKTASDVAPATASVNGGQQ